MARPSGTFTSDITFLDRCKARDIIHKLRNQFKMTDICKQFDLPKPYICFIEFMTKKRNDYLSEKGFPVFYENRYQAPASAIRKVLNWSNETPSA